MDLIDNVLAARRSGVPLLAITTHDQPATVETVSERVNSCSKIAWDCVRGFRPMNDAGGTAIAGLGDLRGQERLALALRMLEKVAPNAMVFLYSASAFLTDPVVVQGMANLRETFKMNSRTLILLGPSFDAMSPSLRDDVVVIDEPLPTDAQLGKRISEVHESAGLDVDKDELPNLVSAVRGLPALFTVEQVVAMSFDEGSLNKDRLWARTEKAINATKGLTMSRKGLMFADLKGMGSIQEFLVSLKDSFRLTVHLDEIEKMLAGSAGDAQDSSGVSTDYLQVLLKKMEGLRWKGLILVGVPGSGKTALSEAIAGEFGVPRIEMDFGGMKDRYVGTSEANVRTAFDVVESLGGSDVIVTATCNKLRSLPAELRRRFTLGVWYFDLLTAEEQEPVKRLYETKLGLGKSEWPDTTDWSGAEIRNCAELAVLRGTSPKDAGRYIVPVAKADPESVEQLRAVADGRFLSVSEEGTWRRERSAGVAARKTRRKIGG